MKQCRVCEIELTPENQYKSAGNICRTCNVALVLKRMDGVKKHLETCFGGPVDDYNWPYWMDYEISKRRARL